MSVKIAEKILNLEYPARLGHIEYCSNYALVRAVTGLDPVTDYDKAWQAFHDAWDYDFRWIDDDGPVPWSKRGRTTDMGHAEFLEGGVDKWEPKPCPFNDVEEVWEFDAVREYGLPDTKELVSYYEGNHQKSLIDYPNQITTGGYYRTIVSGAIMAFGWDMLLAAAADQEKFDRVLEGIFRLSLHHYKAWAKTSIKVFISHDDMVWTEGPFMHPDFYRKSIFPRYKKLWDTLHEAGIKVLYCSDGNWTEFIDDIVDAGADGFIFEPTTDIDYITQKYGKSHMIFGSKVDCRTLTFGTPAQIKYEINETLKIAKDCPGFVFAVGNHITSNISLDNLNYYFDYLTSNWER